MPLVSGKAYVFYNHEAGTALDLDVGSGNVQGWTYHGGPNQQWNVSSNEGEGGVFWYFQNVQNGTFLSYQPPAQDGKRVICTLASSQWRIEPESGNELYKISVFSNPGQCVDLDGGKSADGTAVQLWTSWGGDNQKWEAQAV